MSFHSYEHRTPLLTIAPGGPALLVTLTLPERLEAGHVEFARELAAKAWAYAVAVERRYRGLPPLPGPPVPHCAGRPARHLDPRSRAACPGPVRRQAGGDGVSATVEVRFGQDGAVRVKSYVRLTGTTLVHCSTYPDAAPILAIQDGPADITITSPGRGEVTEQDVTWGRVLAEAVTRYAAELEKITARDRPAAGRDEPGGRAS